MSELPNVSEALHASVQALIGAAVRGDAAECTQVLNAERSNITQCCELLNARSVLPMLWAGVAVEGLASGLNRYVETMEECAARADEMLREGQPPERVREVMRPHSEALSEHLEALQRYVALFQAESLAATTILQVALTVKQQRKQQPKQGEGLN